MRLKCLPFTLLMILPVLQAAGQDYASSSVLNKGRWVRIAVTEPGVYRLDWSQIKDMGFSDPASLVLYGNNAGQLSFYNDGSAPDDLRKIAYKTEKGSDGIFNEGDYLLFYGEGTHRWDYNSVARSYEFRRHHYSDTAYYFATSLSGGAAVIETESVPALPFNRTSSSYDVTYRHENEIVNLIRSGREWYQQVIPGNDNNITPRFSNLVPSEKIRYRLRVLARSETGSSFTLKQGTTVLKTVTVAPVNISDINGVYANISVATDSVLPSSSAPPFSIVFNNNGNLSATGFIDYIEYIARAQLIYTDRQLIISDSRSVASSAVTRFSITGPVPLQVWDVTDPFAPRTLETGFSGGTTTFTASTDSLRKFIAFSSQNLLRPVIRKDPVPNQDLHSLTPSDMIIVSHPLFLEHAGTIADLHLTDDGTSSLIVTPDQIYNEFSGGIPDAAAIRNFIRMMYLRGLANNSPPGYLLLFGDGSYENKTPPPRNTSFIPTWQSVNSHIGVLSFTSDDFYGLLDDGEGE
ncbi:MAG: C25 family cysteine peptidase, partial [Bacteroidales bacterium]|nr:C25 family cysteine peptidase [Bacteroidales bacterium]